MTRIAIIIGSTRPRRRAALVARWVAEVATAHVADRADVTFEVVDLADYALPLLDEPVPAAIGDYHHRHTQRWAATIASFDGFVFVTPEYNHSLPACRCPGDSPTDTAVASCPFGEHCFPSPP